MRHNHLLLDHPLFDERPIKEILEPFGFEVHLEIVEMPDPDEQPEEADAFERDGMAYIDGLTFEHSTGFTEIYRCDNEDGEIVSVAVRAKTPFADGLLHADPAFHEVFLKTQALIDVVAERNRQIQAEGWTHEHDDQYRDGELIRAACVYAAYAENEATHRATLRRREKGVAPPSWPWTDEWWKPSAPRRDLVKSVSLILAEIERLDRADTKLSEGEIPVDASDAGGEA